jgi:hypothetical protein
MAAARRPAPVHNNRIDLRRFLPTGLPAGGYKLTIRLARRTAAPYRRPPPYPWKCSTN